MFREDGRSAPTTGGDRLRGWPWICVSAPAHPCCCGAACNRNVYLLSGSGSAAASLFVWKSSVCCSFDEQLSPGEKIKHTQESGRVSSVLLLETNGSILTGNEGGKTMCLGELLNVPTAMTAFTGMVNIWERGGGWPSAWMLVSHLFDKKMMQAADLRGHLPHSLWWCARPHHTSPPEPWPQESLWILHNSPKLISPLWRQRDKVTVKNRPSVRGSG